MRNGILLSVGGLICLILLSLGLNWFFRTNDLAQEKYFAPKEEQVRREVFEQSKSYNDGMKQELYSMQREYIQAKDEQKAALRSIILHKVDGYDASLLPSDLQLFINQLRSEK